MIIVPRGHCINETSYEVKVLERIRDQSILSLQDWNEIEGSQRPIHQRDVHLHENRWLLARIQL